ncbi:hypothetical protein C6503_16910, partial [Candidatus Poribacteria bacterium]
MRGLKPRLQGASDIGDVAMNTTKKAPVLVVVQLTGGNDFMNTLIPYTAGIYHDSRPVVGIKAEDVIPLDVD